MTQYGMQSKTQNNGNVVPKHGIYEYSTVAAHTLGDRLPLSDGRVFHYMGAGAGAAIVPATILQAPVASPNHVKRATAIAAAIGDVKVKITLGAAAATLNYYQEGWLSVDAGTTPDQYKVSSHPAHAGTGDMWVYLRDPLRKALTVAASKLTLTGNPYALTVISPAAAAQVGINVGISSIDVPVSCFFWGQTWGPAMCLIGAGPPVIGDYLMDSAATAGAAIVYAVTTSRHPIGFLMRAEGAADYGQVFLTLAP